MQPLKFFLASLVVFICAQHAWSAVLRVPSEYNTIQMAMDSVGEEDTILVDPGIYAEALLPPARDFVLRGNIGMDSSEAARPVVDPSTLPDAPNLRCMLTAGGTQIIEDFVFRNRSAMFPRTLLGGIRSYSTHMEFHRCTFDSTYWSIWSQVATFELSHCSFRNITGACIYSNQPVTATNCSFHSLHTGWAAVSPGGEGSRFERCRFSGVWLGGEVIFLRGHNEKIIDCIFDSLGVSVSDMLVFGSSSDTIQGCEFTRCWPGNSLLNINYQGGTTLLRGNRFHDIVGGMNSSGMIYTYPCQSGGVPCDTIKFEENLFYDCWFPVIKAIRIAAPVSISRNHFVRLGGRNPIGFPEPFPPCIRGSAMQGILRENNFLSNGYAVAGQLDARWNWWGDSTGPLCIANPEGSGDSIGADILFDPWYTDSVFTESANERRAPVPAVAQLTIFPNPFNSETRIRLNTGRPVNVKIELFDLLGRSVRELFAGHIIAEREFFFDAKPLPTGLYFVRVWNIDASTSIALTKLVLLK